ncbi:MAG TPA: hypothetical protein PKM88_04660, partial [bacterium]|nr:hypothetical protein [bacterium]
MATALRRPPADSGAIRGLLFAAWAVVVLAAYVSWHPLPMRDGVPVGTGLLTALLMLAAAWPVWRHADPRRGPQAEHLVLLPAGLSAALAMLPVPVQVPFVTPLANTLVWALAADRLRAVYGRTGLLASMLFWFPGTFIMLLPAGWWAALLGGFLAAGLLLCRCRTAHPPHRFVHGAVIVLLVLGIGLGLVGV